jgi:aspartate/methionine/tyrosine aminotransferase
MPRPVPSFRYMEWAKARSPGPRYNLAQSGAPSLGPADLGLRVEDLRFKVRGGYGDRELMPALAARYRVPEAEIVPAVGSSLANWLVLSTLLSPGDLVLVEEPCYESLATIPRLLGAVVRPVVRRFEEDWALPVEAIERGFADGARIAILTDPHNPSGVTSGDDALRRAAAAAEGAGGWLLVDEVYRDYREVSTTRHLGARVIATSSLTKVYGLGGLRAGWVFAPADVAADLHRMQDYLGVEFPGPSASIAVVGLRQADAILERHRALARRGREIALGWIEGRKDLEVIPPGPGLICFPRVTSGADTAAVVSRLEAEHETTAVPGEHFGRPGHLRIGFGVAEETLREGLRRIGIVLDGMGGGGGG